LRAKETKMIKYIAFLRGINVGGHHIVKMEDLRRIFASMKFENVKTYIQSGNVIFEATETNAGKLAEKIERELEKSFGFEIKTMPRTLDELEEIAAHVPFKDAEADAQVYISFLSAAPDAELKNSVVSLSNDFEVFRFRSREMYYLRRPNNPAKDLFSNNFIEKHLKVASTTRNVTTVNKILLLK
jgi:uncharacterized protein (DUF1697 family)